MAVQSKIDYKLVSLLGQNAQESSGELAEKLKISSATVRRKLKKLLESDKLRIIGVVDPAKFGYPLTALITMNVVHEKIEKTMQLLVNQKEVSWLAATTGRFDVMFIAKFPSTAELNDFLRNTLGKLEGIRDSETNVCLDIGKGSYIPFT